MPWSQWSKECGGIREGKKISWEHSHDLYDTIDGRGTCTTKILCIIHQRRDSIFFLTLCFHDANKSFFAVLLKLPLPLQLSFFQRLYFEKRFGYLNVPGCDYIRFQSLDAIHPINITPPNAIYTKTTSKSRKSMMIAIRRLQVLTLLHLHLFGKIISFFSK